ncbi:MAG: hypothetical protein HeimC2_41680 [Candidatus Heimdallarchaeota archaeon LC_2]|nr:MAG: hypothetical protein HeimC2_41680 [Candidatus Heimdallarchaeota archaeon LC_2]
MSAGIIIALVFYLMSLLILIYHLFSKEKNHFLISIILIIIGSFTFQLTESFSSEYLLFFIAIIFSFIGDLFMARKIKLVESRIVNGTIGFGVAHIFYILAFYKLGPQSIELWELGVGIILLCFLYYFVIYSPELHKSLKVATFVYAMIIAILFVVILDFSNNSSIRPLSSIIAVIGIILFILSDSIISYSEFKKEITYSKEIISITYVISQILLQLTPVILVI